VYSRDSLEGVKVVTKEMPSKNISQPLSLFRFLFWVLCSVTHFLHKILKIKEPPIPIDIQNRKMILCQVKVGGMNPVDAKYLYGDKVPHIFQYLIQGFLNGCGCGIDFSGVVIDAPKGSNFNKGDKIYGTMPPSYGSFSQYILCPSDFICLKPMNYSYQEAAALPLVGLTALQAFKDLGLKESEHVLILGASGGTGHIAVQIARAMGARVTAVCSDKNIEFVKELDADDIVIYNDPKVNVIDKLLQIVNHNKEDGGKSKKFDIVFDSVSSHDMKDNVLRYYERIINAQLIHPRGVYVNLGGNTIDWFKAHLKRFFYVNIFPRNQELFWVRFPDSSKDLKDLKTMCECGKLKVKVGHIFPLNSESVQEAFRLQLSRHVAGKIVIDID